MKPAIPETTGDHCLNLTPQEVRRRLDAEELNRLNPVPGICRFCRNPLGLDFLTLDLGEHGKSSMPVYQCNHATKLWQAADDIRSHRIREAEQERKKTKAKK